MLMLSAVGSAAAAAAAANANASVATFVDANLIDLIVIVS